MDLNEYASKLKNLKRKRMNLVVKNSKETKRERTLHQLNQKPAVYSMNAQSDEESDQASKGNDNVEKNKLFGYSIREYEQWKKREDRSKLDSAKYGDLAKSTYDKEVQRLSARRDNLEKTKLEEEGSRTVNNQGKIVIEDNPDLIDKLAESVRQTAKERYAKIQRKLQHRDVTAVPSTGFVNEKNKQFNAKLDRQAKKMEHSDSGND
ncbi:LADA_0B04522g1_1 [Lachancea dasiensis]|uniref:Pre-mRNA-splicing factor SYF2 n=1 Tax=Lachancea dasiensis TaxID=1072105 RepID=A0A1G4IT08_9SACH|nr:LADA_0B04522g1_1 [Lachancea dasiensis]